MITQEIRELLNYNEKESEIYMPNELFDILMKNTNNSSHLSLTYAYMYFITWQYKYLKHIVNDNVIDNKNIKEILGYNATTKGLDYITKKNGLLDSLGLTETIKNIPVSKSIDYDGVINFETIYSNDEELKHLNLNRKYTLKFPVKAFNRYGEKGISYGTYFNKTNTHLIPFEVFMFCMGNREINCTGFYLYAYINRMNDFYPNGWNVSYDDMANGVGLTRETLARYISRLRSYNMITCNYNYEYFTVLADDLISPNSYIANDFKEFSHTPIKYNKINRSKGEYKIRQYLKDKEITFEEQYSFVDCKDKHLLAFDFAIFKDDILIGLIEFDGQHHYYAIDFWGGEEYLASVMRRDKIKNEYCKKNNIPLLRVPYWEEENIDNILDGLLAKWDMMKSYKIKIRHYDENILGRNSFSITEVTGYKKAIKLIEGHLEKYHDTITEISIKVK